MPKKMLIILGIVISAMIILALIWWRQSSIEKVATEQKVYRIGLLQMAPTVSENMAGFKLGMEELGYKEGKNVQYTYLDAEGDLKKIEEYAKQLVAMKPDLIFVNTSPATAAIMKATQGTDIKVVFSMVGDPLGAGFIESIKSSGNNLTGTSAAYVDIAPKRLAILKEVDPSIEKVLIFYRPEDKSGGPATANILDKAGDIGVEIVTVQIEKKEDIKDYLDKLESGQVDAIMDPADSMVTAGLVEWGVDKAKELRIPLFMLSRGECEKGALASYGVDYIDLGKQSSLIANQVLAGIRPTDIPTEMPRKFFFAVNLQTAQAIGLEIPEAVLYKADLVIK